MSKGIVRIQDIINRNGTLLSFGKLNAKADSTVPYLQYLGTCTIYIQNGWNS